MTKVKKMTLIEAENAIVEEFSMYEEWLDKYEYLIELGKSLDAVRIEFFGDDVEQISIIDPLTGAFIDELDELPNQRKIQKSK